MICKSKQQQLKLDLQACWSTSMQDQDQGRDGELQEMGERSPRWKRPSRIWQIMFLPFQVSCFSMAGG
jgi:hypothetical protein